MTEVQDVLLARQDDADWQGQRIGLDQLSSAVTIQGLRYWNRLRGTRSYPARNDIRPREIAPILRNIWIVIVHNEGDEFEYRFAGDVIVQLHGLWIRHSTTADLDLHFPGYGRLVKRLYLHIVRTREPLAIRGEVRRQSASKAGTRTMFKQETVFLPLGERDGTVNHILGFCDVIGEFWERREQSIEQLFPQLGRNAPFV